ncbi:hypothetical protein FBUS_08220, partial [Fasciolopsis buskii]
IKIDEREEDRLNDDGDDDDDDDDDDDPEGSEITMISITIQLIAAATAIMKLMAMTNQIIWMGAQTIESRLSEYECKARAVCIGVNHLALDTERIQQEELLKKVKQLELELKDSAYQKTSLPQRALDVRVLTENVSETSVQLSSPKALPESVHVKKELGGTVQSCWNYVSHLSRLTQVHIRNAAEYHQVRK